MKFNKVLLAAAVTLGLVSTAQANSGQFTFTGTVMDIPCSVMPDELEKDFQFGILSQAALQDGGRSHEVSRIVKLDNCSVATKDTATFAFVGLPGHSTDVFEASGVDNLGIQLTLGGQVISPNGSVSHKLHNGDNSLEFKAVAVGATGADPADAVGVGDFNAVATFAITYS